MFESFTNSLSVEAIFILRIFISSLCGGIIGFERSQRQKDAGIRTHIIVALGSALCMVISKYGFNDVLASGLGYSTDASRIAANIITGVSFLGAGVIFIKEQFVKGLTTAAGIWATSAVGMAIGSGLYITGIASTVMLIILQVVLHKFSSKIEGNHSKAIYIEVENTANYTFEIGAIITRYNSILHTIEILYTEEKMKKISTDSVVLRVVLFPKNDDALKNIISDIKAIAAVKNLYVE